jgi:hypothetical protein
VHLSDEGLKNTTLVNITQDQPNLAKS